MRDFEEALAIVLEIEGGKVDDPRDPGGPTNLGVTEVTLQEAKDWGLVSSTMIVGALTRETAKMIYRKLFWERCGCDQLPYPLALVLFDTAVNHGAFVAKRWLQAALGVKVDGVIGEKTVVAARAASAVLIIRLLCKRRMKAYLREQGKAAEEAFELGWANRVVDIEAAGIVAAMGEGGKQ